MLKLSFIQEPALPGPFSQFSQSTQPTTRVLLSVIRLLEKIVCGILAALWLPTSLGNPPEAGIDLMGPTVFGRCARQHTACGIFLPAAGAKKFGQTFQNVWIYTNFHPFGAYS